MFLIENMPNWVFQLDFMFFWNLSDIFYITFKSVASSNLSNKKSRRIIGFKFETRCLSDMNFKTAWSLSVAENPATFSQATILILLETIAGSSCGHPIRAGERCSLFMLTVS